MIAKIAKAAIRDPDPVVFLENELLYGVAYPVTDQVVDKDLVLPIGKAKIQRPGQHCTIVTYSKAVEFPLEVANELAGKGIEVEVINLKSLRPMDAETIFKPVQKTHYLLTVEQGCSQCGIGSEIVARVIEHETFFHLDAPVWRVTGVDIPIPYAKSLEAASLQQIDDVEMREKAEK